MTGDTVDNIPWALCEPNNHSPEEDAPMLTLNNDDEVVMYDINRRESCQTICEYQV